MRHYDLMTRKGNECDAMRTLPAWSNRHQVLNPGIANGFKGVVSKVVAGSGANIQNYFSKDVVCRHNKIELKCSSRQDVLAKSRDIRNSIAIATDWPWPIRN